jgi:ribosomal protein S18 acetylase RimI-like enzyme
MSQCRVGAVTFINQNPISIVPATGDTHFRIVHSLFQEYAASIGINLCFQNFDEELTTLPGKYAPPNGQLLIAYVDDQTAGCIGLRPLMGGICEMKRLYVRPAYRNQRIGQKLVERIIREARQIGYARMRLDTLSSMSAAMRLYKRFGFVEIPAYYENPEPESIYFELIL